MTNKLTNKTALLYAIDLFTKDEVYFPDNIKSEDIVAKLQKMVEQLDKKSASPKKLTAQQVKNEELKSVISDFLIENKEQGFTVSDLLKAIPELEGDSNQHVSFLMNALAKTSGVEKYSEKRRTYFRAVVEG